MPHIRLLIDLAVGIVFGRFIFHVCTLVLGMMTAVFMVRALHRL